MNTKKIVLPLAIWIGVGVALGVATGNLALWLGLGVAFGVISGLIMNRRGDPEA